MKKIRIIDVAEHAGVSKSTVSQYLNGRFTHMSEVTRSRIESSISELNYIPNPIARSLKTDKTKTIGVIVRDITGFYTSRVIRGIDDYCKNSQYDVLIYNTDFDPQLEAQSLKALKQLRVDGIIIASSGKNNGLISEYIESDTPLVQFQLEYEQCKSNIVVSDYEKAAFEATEYLIELGHKKICFLTQEYQGIYSREQRFKGYTAALTKHGIDIDSSLIQYWSREEGFNQSIEDILRTEATVFFTQHLAITIDLLKKLNKLNIQIPTDVSILGFDELPMAEFLKVPITVIKQDPYEVGMKSAKLLLDTITGDISQNQQIVVPCSLVKRDSCKKLV